MELRPGTPKEAGILPERIERARDLCAGWVKSGHTPSLVVLVARRGVVVLHEAFGCLRPEADSPSLRADAIFPISSVTKPITATLVMSLVEDGLLGLNRPVLDYIPELCGKGAEEVLVHHLLTHTSGYNDLVLEKFARERVKEPIEFPPCEETQHPLLNWFLTMGYPCPLWKAPGEEMSMCLLNYELLAEIVRRVSGRSIADLAEQRVFGPLGMFDSYYVVPEAVRERIVKRLPDAAHNQQEGVRPPIDSRQTEELPSGNGGVYSTARDVAVFGQTFLNGGTYGPTRILSGAGVTAMTRNQVPGIGVQMGNSFKREASYGYGWIIESTEKWKYFHGTLQPVGTFSHPGAGGSMLWVDPVHDIVGVYLSVTLEMTEVEEPLWNFDLFQNVVTSAVED